MTSLSIVIPTRNRSQALARCLSALRREAGAEAEIIIVDDASNKPAAQRTIALGRSVDAIVVPLTQRSGPAVARNAGIRVAKGSWIAFIDDDVVVQAGWGATLREVLTAARDDVVGIEGRIEPSGDGVWDREVKNLSGGLYLTSHIIFRAESLREAGCFDECFFDLPFCEDHELAARMLRRGEIVFEPRLVAVHLPRSVPLVSVILNAPGRIRKFLDAEYYFYSAQPAHYHRFRHANTFWGTYASIAVKNVLRVLRRRSPAQLAAHPMQTLALIASSMVEQVCAWLLAPHFLREWHCRMPPLHGIDMERTARQWNIPGSVTINDFKLRPSVFRRVFFSSPYNVKTLLRRLGGTGPPRLYIRVDDVFFLLEREVAQLCAVFSDRRLPFLAAVTGSDMQSSRAEYMLPLLASSGATIALHGFNHSGRYGPHQSECLQLKYTDFDRRLRHAISAAATHGPPPCAFVAPYNAIDWEQVRFLARYFTVICAGPESARFNGHIFGPVAVGKNSWYFPSMYPYYGKAASMLTPKRLRAICKTPVNACVTIHCGNEASDGYYALNRLLDAIGPLVRPWTDYGCNAVVMETTI